MNLYYVRGVSFADYIYKSGEVQKCHWAVRVNFFNIEYIELSSMKKQETLTSISAHNIPVTTIQYGDIAYIKTAIQIHTQASV